MFSSSVDFDNTGVAFQARSDTELRKAHTMFRMLNLGPLNSLGIQLTQFALNLGLPVTPLLKATIYAHFCGGISRETCQETIDKLAKREIFTCLDYAVEGGQSNHGFDQCCQEVLKVIRFAGAKKPIPFAVFKPSGLGSAHLMAKIDSGATLSTKEKQDWREIRGRVNTLCKATVDAGINLFIDAEESWIQDCIDSLCTEMMERYNKKAPVIFNTIQLYRVDRLDYLQASIKKARQGDYHLGLKLVRGAYLEKERDRAQEKGYASPVYANKDTTDKSYNLALELCLENIDCVSVCAATHNEESSLGLVARMRREGIASNHPHIWFSQLYGMGDTISYNLAKAGYQVCKYLPYGPLEEMLPYLMRRAEENSSITGQMSRELRLLAQEIKRRRI
jgi:proline dehydrogenase